MKLQHDVLRTVFSRNISSVDKHLSNLKSVKKTLPNGVRVLTRFSMSVFGPLALPLGGSRVRSRRGGDRLHQAFDQLVVVNVARVNAVRVSYTRRNTIKNRF